MLAKESGDWLLIYLPHYSEWLKKIGLNGVNFFTFVLFSDICLGKNILCHV